MIEPILFDMYNCERQITIASTLGAAKLQKLHTTWYEQMMVSVNNSQQTATLQTATLRLEYSFFRGNGLLRQKMIYKSVQRPTNLNKDKRVVAKELSKPHYSITLNFTRDNTLLRFQTTDLLSTTIHYVGC